MSGKLLTLVSILLTGAMAGACDSGVRQPPPDVVALVNGERVMRADYQRMRANPAFQRKLRDGEGPNSGTEDIAPALRDKLALDQLVATQLLLQEARRRQLSVAEREVDDAVAKLRRRFADLSQFANWIKQQGLKEADLFASVRSDLLLNRISAELVKDVNIGERELLEYFRRNRERWVAGTEVHLRIIATRDLRGAEAFVRTLREGHDFSRLARVGSLGAQAANGGDVGWMELHSLPETLRNTVNMMKKGQAFGPIQRGDDFLIVKLEDRRQPRLKPLVEVRNQVHALALAERQRSVLSEWIRNRRTQSQIEVFL